MFIYQHTKYDDMSALLNSRISSPRSPLCGRLSRWPDISPTPPYGDENLTGVGALRCVCRSMGVTANFFPTLRPVTPALGRNFQSTEDRKDGPAG